MVIIFPLLLSLLYELIDSLSSKRLSMQIVPYMPVHPGQLQSTTVNSVNQTDNQMEEEAKAEDKLSPVPVPRTSVHSDDNLFKRPFTPPAYTVEEPCDFPSQRPHRMKRSLNIERFR